MIKLSTNDYNTLSEIALLSNTPGFMYNSIRDSKISLKISNKFDEKQLLSSLGALIKKKVKLTYRDALTIYAIAIACEVKGPETVAKLLRIKIPWLQWWNELLEIIQCKVRSDSYHSIVMPLSIRLKKTHSQISSSTNISKYEFKTK